MRVIIIEDEKPAARRLQRMLEEKNIAVQTMLHSVEEAVEWFEENPQPDLIFLDIQLSDGLSFEIFEHVAVDSAIIFTTAYDQYALQAFKLNSIDYLLKPIDKIELQKAVDQYLQQQQTKTVALPLGEIQQMLGYKSTSNYKTRFSVKVGQHIKRINLSEIVCFYSENKGTYVHTRENRSYLLDWSLEALDPLLDPEIFYRTGRKYIVHIDAIRDIISYTNSRLQLKLEAFNESDVIVARDRVKNFKTWIG
ncbi:MAG: LytTR family DNA-binding domain-containing protein [Flavobacteriaceae bacterium]|nr:LytTR family DNA-binding domain-containing protein [Flavobacteriaceae bacterium]